jgi:hypothetical protein
LKARIWHDAPDFNVHPMPGLSLASDQLGTGDSHLRSGKDQARSEHLNPAEARYALTWLADMGVDPVFLQGRDGL